MIQFFKSFFSVELKDSIKNKIKEIRQKTLPQNIVSFISKFYLLKKDFKGHVMYYRLGSNDKSVIDDVITNNEYTNYGFDLTNNSIVFDIGAHIGSFSVQMGPKIPNGKIYAFEPFIENFNLAKKNIQLNNLHNIELFNKGVLDEDKSVRFYVSNSNTGCHGIFKRTEKEARYFDIECISLDNFIKLKKITQIDLLKLDCEGSEYAILLNSDLNIVKSIILEYHEFQESKENFNTLSEKLIKKGFKLIKNVRYASEPVGVGVAYFKK